ncbi:hypothetical protein NPS33_18980 [Pseudomonas putida]|jgi:hypothetical protein|uniref:hypothetical protein n=1 Tax=Pseudomonas putida TaxID=303 RepID=UPI002363B319|nr:hypothetical protein [Pseudomonas putida]MDD2016979.1 hypothetical protein [Pseudomonas putida]HDS1772859.1 hypothetical protein [Pseudomonas putida]
MSKAEQKQTAREFQKVEAAYVQQQFMASLEGGWPDKWVVMVVDDEVGFISGHMVGGEMQWIPDSLVRALSCDCEESAKALADAYKSAGVYGGNAYPMSWSDASMIVAPIG